jgi:hypothetical protein
VIGAFGFDVIDVEGKPEDVTERTSSRIVALTRRCLLSELSPESGLGPLSGDDGLWRECSSFGSNEALVEALLVIDPSFAEYGMEAAQSLA